MEAKVGAASRISYEEFEPFCKWQREEARDTLVVHLPEFKKEQLRVNISNRGILKVSGERSVDAGKKSKFYKEVVVPRNCNTNGIQAKFAHSQLFIIMPKNPNAVIPEQNKLPEQAADSNVSSVYQNSKAEAVQDQSSQKKKMVPSPTPNITTQNGNNSKQSKDHLAGEEPSSVSRGKMAVNVGLGVAVLAALVAFVVYMYQSNLVDQC